MSSIHKAFSYKGIHKHNKYFEGWYYKMVSKDHKHILSLIPGISLNKTDSHAFIQVIYNEIKTDDQTVIYTDYIKFDKEAFKYIKKELVVSIKENSFSLEHLNLHLNSKKTKLEGKIDLIDLSPIQTSILSPSIMGVFSYIPFMECYHSVVSMNHQLSGKLNLNGKVIDFNGGLGYIEKDYGKSFPIDYVWLQSNHFKHEDTSLMVSIATIPFLGMKFKGVIALLKYNDKEYRFATYNFAKIKEIKIDKHHVHIALTKHRYKLIVDAYNKDTEDLPSPKNGVMNQTIKEGLSGNINVALYDKQTLIYEDTGYCAGIEIMME